LPDNIGLTEFTKDVVKVIAAVDHKEEVTIGPRAITHVGNITGSVILLPAWRNATYAIGLIASRQNIYPKKNNKYITSSGNILRMDRLFILVYFLLNLKALKVY
jgi:hypothetical protein